jgi:hypothetical protein
MITLLGLDTIPIRYDVVTLKYGASLMARLIHGDLFGKATADQVSNARPAQIMAN